ncbi:MAG: hypothetical protein LE169_04545 [Endomicrobium sp.]|nr:hypothetical protein [Endomicrobium sp.]
MVDVIFGWKQKYKLMVLLCYVFLRKQKSVRFGDEGIRLEREIKIKYFALVFAFPKSKTNDFCESGESVSLESKQKQILSVFINYVDIRI